MQNLAILARYTLVPRESRFLVQAFAGGLLSMFAHNPVMAIRDFTGEMRFTPGTFEGAAFELTVRADSLEVIGNVNPRDKPEIQNTMRREVLEVTTYPEVRFHSTDIRASKIQENTYGLRIRGELALHGVMNSEQVAAQLTVLDGGIRLTGEHGLRLSSSRIKRVTALGGTIVLKDEVRFAFDLVGKQVIGS
jgi:polyisoprenoid-binding protein YceI